MPKGNLGLLGVSFQFNLVGPLVETLEAELDDLEKSWKATNDTIMREHPNPAPEKDWAEPVPALEGEAAPDGPPPAPAPASPKAGRPKPPPRRRSAPPIPAGPTVPPPDDGQ
ncbi:MAG TPA: hypothetical protein VLK25_08955 [Allosphingosinicella sp.]|nr:hypothetical protein [Allosphingosinicella sp.]